MVYPNRQRTFYWLINLILYALLNMFVLRINQGVWFDIHAPYQSGPLIPMLLSPLNIFQFPSHIITVAMYSALICAVPILIAQLYNLLPSVPFVLAVLFFGHNPILSLCLLVSCVLVSFEPLRFKSKFVSAVVALTPELLYWGLFNGESPEQDVLRWACLYVPWALAFLICVTFFGIVLAIGHFLRYRPGVMMPLFAALLAATVFIFNSKIGMHERDFRAEVVRYSPSQMPQFQPRSISQLLEQELAAQRQRTPWHTDDTILRSLKDQWREAFQIQPSSTAPAESATTADPALGIQNNPDSAARRAANDFDNAQLDAIDHITAFLQSNPNGSREPDAIYYLALLYDLKVDPRALNDENTLQFYAAMPTTRSVELWRDLIDRFGDSAVSVEARYRLAWRLSAGAQNSDAPDPFAEPLRLLEQAKQLCEEILQKRRQETADTWISSIFTPPSPTVTTKQLTTLHDQIAQLIALITFNRTGHPNHYQRLARFISIDPHHRMYKQDLTVLRLNAVASDPLLDNIVYALTMLETNIDQQILLLNDMIELYPGTDGAMQAQISLAQILIDKRNRGELPEQQQINLDNCLQQLRTIIQNYPNSYFAEKAQDILDNYPQE